MAYFSASCVLLRTGISIYLLPPILFKLSQIKRSNGNRHEALSPWPLCHQRILFAFMGGGGGV